MLWTVISSKENLILIITKFRKIQKVTYVSYSTTAASTALRNTSNPSPITAENPIVVICDIDTSINPGVSKLA
jgi:hypothetical protein